MLISSFKNVNNIEIFAYLANPLHGFVTFLFFNLQINVDWKSFVKTDIKDLAHQIPLHSYSVISFHDSIVVWFCNSQTIPE